MAQLFPVLLLFLGSWTLLGTPPSAPNDGFNEIISGFKSGQTAMIFHHIGSAKTMTDGEYMEAYTFARARGVKAGAVEDKLFLPGFQKLAKLIESGHCDAALAGEVPVARSASIGHALRSTMRLYAAGWRPVVDSKVWFNVLTGKHAAAAELRRIALPD